MCARWTVLRAPTVDGPTRNALSVSLGREGVAWATRHTEV